jgi:hypothetical protein
MQSQTESCFTRTILIENENSVKNIFVGTKRTTEYKTRKLLIVAQTIRRQMLGSLMKWKMSERKWLCRIRYAILEEITQYSGFSGLLVSMLAFGTQVRGFKPG